MTDDSGALTLRFGILGPLYVAAGIQPVLVGGARSQSILAALLLDANRVVSVPQLVEAAWGEDPPHGALTQVRNRISTLRRILRDARPSIDPITTIGSGYIINADDRCLDLLQFDSSIADARALRTAGKLPEARAVLDNALRLWRGPALDGLITPYMRDMANSIEERRVSALEGRIELDLELGAHSDVISELTGLVAAHPYREGLHALLMLALYRAGRQAEAMEAFRRARSLLVEQLGVEPGLELRRLHQAMLHADAELLQTPRLGRLALDLEGHLGRQATAGPSTDVSSVPIPRELPADTPGFVGRADALDILHGRLPDAGSAMTLTVIAGTAGVGKTALAVHWAHRVAARFPDGQLFLNLNGYAEDPPTAPLEALGRLLRSLGTPPREVPMDPAEAAARYRSIMADRRMLVILDNAHSEEQVRPLLPGSAGCAVVVTSRGRLAGLVARDGAYALTLDVLTPDASRELLVHMLGNKRVAAEPHAAAELATVCAHLPLALRIAATNLVGCPEQSIRSRVEQLSPPDRLAKLAIEGDSETAVQTAFDLSYRSVPSAAQRLFRLLGLVPGADFTNAAAASLAGIPPAKAAELLDDLARAHLVAKSSSGRFSFHDLLRRYAAERAEAENVGGRFPAEMDRFCRWHLHVVHAASRLLYPHTTRLPEPPTDSALALPVFADRAAALAWFDAEHDNLIAVVHYAHAHRSHPVAWQLVDALRAYLWRRGHLRDWLDISRIGLAASETAGDVTGQMAMWQSLGHAFYTLGRYKQAEECLNHAYDLSSCADWWQGQGVALMNLGIVHGELGRMQEAVRHHSRALKVFRQQGDRWREAHVLHNLGNDYLYMGQLQAAIDTLTRARHLFHDVDAGGSGEASVLQLLGAAQHALGQFDLALKLSASALSQHAAIGSRREEAITLATIATVHADLGDHPNALARAHAAVDLAREVGEAGAVTEAVNALAAIHHALGKHHDAVLGYEDMLSTVGEMRLYWRAQALIGLTRTHGQLGNYESAIAHARQALDLAAGCSFQMLEGLALTALAGLHARAGKADEAETHARRALHIHRRIGHRMGQARTLTVLGLTARDRGVHHRDALDVYVELGVPPPLCQNSADLLI